MPKNDIQKDKAVAAKPAASKPQTTKKANTVPSAKKTGTAAASSNVSKSRGTTSAAGNKSKTQRAASVPEKQSKPGNTATVSAKEENPRALPAPQQSKADKKRESNALMPTEKIKQEPVQRSNASKAVGIESPASDTLSQAAPAVVAEDAPSVEMPAPTRKEWRLLLRRVVACVLFIAVLAASVLVYLYRPTAYTERKTSVAFAYSDVRGVTTVLVNGSTVGDPLPGICRTYSYSGDGNACAAIVDDDLYLVRRDKLQLVAVNVQDYAMAQNGSALAYRTDKNELFYCILGRDTAYYSITREASDAGYRLSPNGKELFYTYHDGDVQRAAIYSRTNSAPRFETTAGLAPVAVGDHCAYLYYRDATGALYYMERKSDAPVLCHSGGDFSLSFNRSFSEMLITSANGVSLWIKGEQLDIPNVANGEHIRFLANHRAAVQSHPNGTQYLVKSFLECYYVKTGAAGEGAMLAYLDRDGTLTGVSFVSQANSDVTVTDKGVYYIEITEKSGEVQRNLFHCKLGKTEPTRLSFSDVNEFRVSRDGDRLFYTDAHGALYTMKRGGDPVRLKGADSIVAGSLTVTADNVVYYTVGDTLWRSDNGAEPIPLRETPATARADAYTAYFTQTNASGAITLHTSHRAREGSALVAEDITVVK